MLDTTIDELGNPAKQARYRLERLTKALDAKGPDFEGRSFEIDELQSPEMIANASWKDTGDDMTPDECIALSEYLGRDVIEPMWYSRNEGGE